MAGDDELDDLALGLGELVVRCGTSADPPQFRMRLVHPPLGAESLEDLGRLLQCLSGGALVLCAAADGSECEEGAGELERVGSLRRLGRDGCQLERADRRLVSALCGEDEAPAAEYEWAERGVAVCRVLIELREEPLRLAKGADRDECLDPGRARQASAVDVELLDVAEQRCRLSPARRSEEHTSELQSL